MAPKSARGGSLKAMKPRANSSVTLPADAGMLVLRQRRTLHSSACRTQAAKTCPCVDLGPSTARPPFCAPQVWKHTVGTPTMDRSELAASEPDKGGHDHRRPSDDRRTAASRGLPSRRNSIQPQSLIKAGKTTFRKTTLRAEFRRAPQDKRLRFNSPESVGRSSASYSFSAAVGGKRLSE